jgi:hypothetical protein
MQIFSSIFHGARVFFYLIKIKIISFLNFESTFNTILTYAKIASFVNQYNSDTIGKIRKNIYLLENIYTTKFNQKSSICDNFGSLQIYYFLRFQFSRPGAIHPESLQYPLQEKHEN